MPEESDENPPPPLLRDEPGFAENASVLEDEVVTQERYEEIQARTMWQMTDDVNDGKQRLLFLTNKQAELLAHPDNVSKILTHAFEIKEDPKLLIILQWDGGFRRFLQTRPPAKDPGKWHRSVGAFLTSEEARAAEAALDRFMLQVLIPLAEQTNAVVICNAVREFELSASFLRMVSVQRSKYAGGRLPFTILATTDEIFCFYANSDADAHWRTVRRQSRAWAKRDEKMVSEYTTPYIMKHYTRYDLTPDAPNLIVTDCIDTRSGKGQTRGPACDLDTAIIRHLGSYLPSIVFRTGLSYADCLNDTGAASLLRVVDAMNSGCPVVLLDVREHQALHATTRQQMIDKAKAQYSALCDGLVAKGALDQLVCCALARFHDMLFGDGGSSGLGARTCLGGRGSEVEMPQTIHEALSLRMLRDRHGTEEDTTSGRTDQPFRRATDEQIRDVAFFISQQFTQGWIEWRKHRGTWDEEARGGGAPDVDEYFDRAAIRAQIFHMLLSHDCFHGANCTDIYGTRRLLQTLVNLNRLPKENTIEVLELLQQAWTEHDIAVHLSKKYAWIASVLYAMTLAVGVATIAVAAVFADLDDPLAEEDAGGKLQQHIVFGLSMLNTALLLALKFYNPAVRSNQLRGSAATLESIIWLFRTRVGVFAAPPNATNKPTAALQQAMVSWHADAVGGTDLLQTSIERKYPDSVYKHCQYSGMLPRLAEFKKLKMAQQEIAGCMRQIQLSRSAGEPSLPRPTAIPGAAADPAAEIDIIDPGESDGTSATRAGGNEELAKLRHRKVELEAELSSMSTVIDDHQSPVRPAEYIELRLLMKRDEYKVKIPHCYTRRRFFEFVLTACTLASASLSYIGTTSHYVAVSAAVAAAVTSWLSYDDLTRRIERYSLVVRSLNDLIWWWKSLGDADRANTEQIARLVETGETILATERLAWIAAAKKGGERDTSEGGGGGEKDGAGVKKGAGGSATGEAPRALGRGSQ